MEKEKDVVNIIFKISELVREIDEDDFKYLEEIVESQKNYFNPLKVATENRQHELAKHNERIICLLRELKELVNKKID